MPRMRKRDGRLKPLPRFSAENILAVYARADDATITEGLEWYQRANDVARDICGSDDPMMIERAAGVIAALSPQKSWPQNIALARRAFRDGEASGHTGANCENANKILNGASIGTVLKGPKTFNFYLCIIYPNDETFVCVDRHAVAVALDRDVSARAGDFLNRKGAFEKAQEAYREAASLIPHNVRPMQVQAVTWCQWRKEA